MEITGIHPPEAIDGIKILYRFTLSLYHFADCYLEIEKVHEFREAIGMVFKESCAIFIIGLNR
jgi:hypothetical protein